MDISRLADLLKNKASSALEDYSQLADAYPNLKNFAGALVGNVERNVPTQAELQNPEAMAQWSQSVALNAPMGLTFAGKMAKNAPLDKFKEAEKIINEEYPAFLSRIPIGSEAWHNINKIIHEKTGIHYGADMKPRFEINDSEALFTPNKWDAPYANAPEVLKSQIKNSLKHDDLFENYPDIANYDVLLNPNIKSLGEWRNRVDFLGSKIDPHMQINYSMPDTVSMNRNYLQKLNDPEHPYFWKNQAREDIESGLSPREAIKDWRNELNKINNSISELISGKIPDYKKNIFLHELQHGIQEKEGFAQGGSAKNLDYKNLAGEAEARAVEKRANYTPEQRMKIYPLENYDVPISRLITIMRGQ